jgi:hypothetical protein
MKKILPGAMQLISIISFAQQDTTKTNTANTNPLTFSGYIEGYYSYDFNEPPNNNKPAFIYNHSRNNEFNVNLAFVRGTYNGDKVRGTVAFGAGTYMNANYAAEPGTLKNIFEANAGFKIGRKNLWIDAGILPSHIGFESAVSKDCWTLTRSLLADNTPFFQGGVRLSFTSDNGKWFLSGLAINGWQRITRVDGNSLISFGTQITYKPSASATLNYSTFIGTDKPDSARLIRIYHNLYGIFQVSKQFGIIAGFDIGTEQKSKGSGSLNTIYSPVLIAKYSIDDKWAIAARGEYYSDENGILISTGTANGFKTSGLSFNADYAPVGNAVIRLELRALNSKDPIFIKRNGYSGNDTFITSSIAISF